MTADQPPDNDTRSELAAEAITGAVTGAVGVAAGAALQNPVLAALLGGLSPIVAVGLRRLFHDWQQRQLSPREVARVEQVLVIAARRIREKEEAGETLRTDGFFELDDQGRIPAEEVADRVLRAAREESEERKLPYIASLLAHLSFLPGISRGSAAGLIQKAERLTYQQLCILTWYARHPRTALRLPELEEADTTQWFFLSADVTTLCNEGLLQAPAIRDRIFALNPLPITALGEILHGTMDLQSIPVSDLRDIEASTIEHLEMPPPMEGSDSL